MMKIVFTGAQIEETRQQNNAFSKYIAAELEQLSRDILRREEQWLLNDHYFRGEQWLPIIDPDLEMDIGL